jgi:hypothetical protein
LRLRRLIRGMVIDLPFFSQCSVFLSYYSATSSTSTISSETARQLRFKKASSDVRGITDDVNIKL